MAERIDVPPTLQGDEKAQLQQVWSYLYQLSEAINNNLDGIGGNELTDSERKTMQLILSAGEKAPELSEMETLKSLIIKTADFVQTSLQEYRMNLLAETVESGKFGRYVRSTGLDVAVTPEGIMQNYSFQEIIQGLKVYEINAKNYIKTGLLRTVNSLPVYGVAIGKDVITFSEDGTETYNDGNKVAELTADELSFWQNGVKVAGYTGSRISFYYNGSEVFYILNGKLYAVGDMEITNGKKMILASGAGLDVESGGNMNLNSGGNMTVKSGGTLQVQNSSNNNIIKMTNAGLDIESGGAMAVKSGGAMTVKSGGTLQVQNSSNNNIIKMTNAGLDIESGGNINIKSGGTFAVKNANNSNVVKLSNTGMDIESGGNINIKSGGSMQINSGGNFSINNTNFVVDSNYQYIRIGDTRLEESGLKFEIDNTTFGKTITSFGDYVHSSISTQYPKLSVTTYVNRDSSDQNLTKQAVYFTYQEKTGATQRLIFDNKWDTKPNIICDRRQASGTMAYIGGKLGMSGGGEWDVVANNVTYSTLTQTSSREIKHDIQKMESNGDRIDQLEPVTFIYNNDPEERRRTGLIYEDTVGIMPEICTETEDFKAINYVELIPMLLKEIQDLRARVKALEERQG